MNKIFAQTKISRTIALLLTAFLSLPLLTACGGSNEAIPPRDSRYPAGQTSRPVTPQARQGLSTGQKVAILAGAAALYYLYNQHRNKQEQGPQGKYYLSKNGRVYYRDAQGAAHWVTPPPEGIRVPESEAQRYRDFQGYNGQSTGRDLTDLAPAQ
ncbi:MULTISPECIES: hypothetical protein [Aerosakkonema]|uniref:hypothetical protein n=1 Tax=Aerosakkonema TaxID=1246629 RepID=UPI0035BB5251